MPDISEIVDVTITVQSAALTRKGFSSLMTVGADADFGSGFANHEVRKYVTAQQLGEDVDVLDGEAKRMATAAFSQSPSVSSVYLSKIELPDTPYVLTADGDQNGSLTAPINTTLEIDFDGTNSDITPTMPTSGVITAVDGAGDVWVCTYTNYLQTGPEAYQWTGIFNPTKNGAPVSHLGTWTPINSQPISGISLSAPSTEITSADLDAIAANNNDWFGYSHVFHNAADNATASSWVAANKKYGFFRTYVADGSEAAPLNSKYSSMWYTAFSLDGTIQACIESAIASTLLARIPGSYTAAFKTLEVVSPSKVSATNEASQRSNSCNQYSTINQRDITWDGVTTGGGFIDTYIGVLYLEARITEDVFGYMSSVNKVPYTNPGIDAIVGQVQRRLDQSVEEGYLTDDPQPVATAPRVTDISATDKSNRLLPNVTFTATTAGAIHTVQINGTLIA